MLVEWVRADRELDPLAATGYDGESCRFGVRYPHIMLQLSHMLFGSGFFRKRPGQHELCFETAPVPSTIPSRVAPIQPITGCWSQRWRSVIAWPVLRSNQRRL